MQKIIEHTLKLFREQMNPCDCADSAILQESLLMHGLTKEKQQTIINILNQEYNLTIEFSYDWFTLNDLLNAVKQSIEHKEDDELYDAAIEENRKELIDAGLEKFIAPIEVIHERSEICFSCNYYIPERDMCQLCGCEKLHKKLMLAPSNCPAEPAKWSAVKLN